MTGPPQDTPVDTRASALELYRLGASSFTGDSLRSVEAQSAQRALTYSNLDTMDSNSFSVTGDRIVIDDDGFDLPGVTVPGEVGSLVGYKRTNSVNEDRLSTFTQNRYGDEGAGFDIDVQSLRRVQVTKKMFEATSDLAQPSIEYSTRSHYSNTVDPQSVAQHHAETFAANQLDERVLSDKEQKLESRKRSHPHLYNLLKDISEEVIPEAGTQFGPNPDTGGFGGGSSSTGLRTAGTTTSTITYLNGNLVDDDSYSGDGSEFYAPNLMPDGVTEYPPFVSDYLILPYNVHVNDYIYGFQFLYEDNSIDANNNMIFTSDRKIFRNMYYNNTHTFSDHGVDFTRVMPTPWFDHLYDHPTAVYEPLDTMLQNLTSSDQTVDTMHMTKMQAIADTTSASTISSRSDDYNKTPQIFLHEMGAMYVNFMKPYQDLIDDYNERIRVYDLNSIVPLSDPVSGLPWLNKAKAEYAEVIGAKHAFHKRRDVPKLTNSIISINNNTLETFEASVGTLLFTLIESTKILDDFKFLLETRKTNAESTYDSAISSEKWVTQFVIQGIVINLATIATIRGIVEVAADITSAAVRLGQVLAFLRTLMGPNNKLDGFDSDFVTRLEEIIDRHKDKSETTSTDAPPGPDAPTGGDEPTVPDGAGGDSTDTTNLLADPNTVATAMSKEQYQNYVNSGGMLRPYETLYAYELTLYDTFQTPSQLGMITYRQYLEGRLDYNIVSHGNLHKLNVDNQMPRSVFDYYISNSRTMPIYSFHPYPRIGTSPNSYRELLEDSADYDEFTHRHLWEEPDPGTMATRLTKEQHDFYRNTGGRELIQPFYPYSIIFQPADSDLAPSDFVTYRQYLETRSDYSFANHGNLHQILVVESMSETYFLYWLENGFMPNAERIPPQVGTSPSTYQEYLENCSDYDVFYHRYLWFHDPSNINDPYWTAQGDPQSLERMSSITDSNWLTVHKASEYNPYGYATYRDYILSRTNYNTTLSNMLTEQAFNILGMDIVDHTYYQYIRSRIDYYGTIADMKTRDEWAIISAKSISSAIGYTVYRIERTDYNPLLHAWDAADNLIENTQVSIATGKAGWQSVKLLSASASSWFPDTTNSGRNFYDDVSIHNFDGHGSYTRAFSSDWNEICFTRASNTGVIDYWVYMTKSQMDLILSGNGWVTGTALKTQSGSSQTIKAYFSSPSYDLRAPMIHAGDFSSPIVYEEHFIASGSAAESGAFQPKVANKQYDVYVRKATTTL